MFFPFSVDAVRVLNRAGFAVVVVTNQAGIARGIVDEAFVAEAHRHIADALEAGGARIDGFYYCPHYPDGGGRAVPRRRATAASRSRACCARAAAGSRAGSARARSSSAIAGTTWRRAHAVGARGVLVRTGLGREDEASPQPGTTPDAIVDNLMDAAAWILQQAMNATSRSRAACWRCRRAGRPPASLVVGDLIADEFIYGEIARVSREAPVLILNYDSTEIVPGGAGNAAGNVAALGGASRIVGVAGRDETGRRLLATLKRRRVDVGDVIRPAGYRRRRRRGSSPAASTPPSSRSSGSIAPRVRVDDDARARRSRRASCAPCAQRRRAAGVGLRVPAS